MPYKIVQTIERGKAVLVAIPERWEQDGLLYWPRKNMEKLRKDENSEPDENWSPKNCILKRTNIANLLKAESIIDVMCDHSDTETELEKKRSSQYQHKNTHTQINFYDMAEECSKTYNKRIINADGLTEPHTSNEYFDKEESDLISQEAQSRVVTKPVTEEPQGSIMLQPINVSGRIHLSEERETSIILQPIQDPRVSNDVLTKFDVVSESLQTVTATLQTVIDNQQVLFTTQNKILSKLSEMQTQFEEIAKQLFKPTNSSQSSDIKPISSLKEFQDFENLLSTDDSTIVSELKNKLSVVCSKGIGKGYNNAYILIDVLFERKFLKDCSWAGGSKSDQIKICFKSFTNTIKLFFNILHEADNQFTLVECHKFLKIILRNSRQRCDNKQLRLSSKKNRQKKIKNTPQSQMVESAENQLDKNTPQSQPVESAEKQQNLPQAESMEVS